MTLQTVLLILNFVFLFGIFGVILKSQVVSISKLYGLFGDAINIHLYPKQFFVQRNPTNANKIKSLGFEGFVECGPVSILLYPR